MFLEFYNRIKYYISADRIGPDIITSYWKLYFRSTMKSLCKSKFKYFADSAEFRPGSYATGCSKISLGKRVVVRPLSYLHSDASDAGAEIIIEDDVLLAPGVHIYTNNHAFSDTSTPIINQGYDVVKPVVLKRGCWIGAQVVILPGVIIGKNAVIGSGSVVTKNIPQNSVAVGSPARVIRKIHTRSRKDYNKHNNK